MDPGDIVSRAVDAALAVDARDQIRHWSDRAAVLFGYPAERVVGRRIHEVLSPRDLFGNDWHARGAPFLGMAGNGEVIAPFRFDARCSDGRYLRLDCSVVVVLGQSAGQHTIVYLLRRGRLRGEQDHRADSRDRRPPESGEPGDDDTRQRLDRLTAREREILRLLCRGRVTGQIANELDVSIHTVRNHIRRILAKLEVRRQVEAISIALRHGFD